MPRYSTDVDSIKHKILVEVANAIYNDLGESYLNHIPYIISPGIKPRYRCCVFKEREILRQRIRLAIGVKPIGNKALNTINVIKEACHGCSINRFQVTQNCQRCLKKSCLKACKFGAVSMSATGAYIDQDKCRECGKCVLACPFHAITDIQRPCIKACPVDAIYYDRHKIAVIDQEKCIKCGKCIKDCPFGAICDSSDIAKIIKDFKRDAYTVAIVAPSIEGQFGTANLGAIMNAVRKLGFDEVVEAGLGADAVALNEAHEALHNMEDNKPTITSCCSAFFNLIEKQFPSLMEHVSKTVSPMIAVSRFIRAKNPNAKITFIGPCTAKRSEAKRDIEGNVDYVLTFDELSSMLEAKGISIASALPPANAPKSQPIPPDSESAKLETAVTKDCSSLSQAVPQDPNGSCSLYGRGFALSGGVLKAVVRASTEANSNTLPATYAANGASECIKALHILRAGKSLGDVIEGMICEGGCVGGCGALVSAQECIKNRNLIRNSSRDNISLSLKDNSFTDIPLERTAKN